MNKNYRVIFCDLDGTLIEPISGSVFPIGIWDMKFKFKVLDGIKKLQPDYILIVSNQGGIENGTVNKELFEFKLEYVAKAISEYCGVPCLSKYCPSNDKNNPFRKPNTTMLSEFYNTLNTILDTPVEKSDCLMIGDASGLPGQFSDSDKKTAENFKIDYIDVNYFLNN